MKGGFEEEEKKSHRGKNFSLEKDYDELFPYI